MQQTFPDSMENKDHKYYGVEFNNAFWKLFSKKDRTAEENLDMLNYAFASLTHWKLFEGGTVVNEQRGEYLIAKCYLAMGEAENCAKYANSCLQKTQDHLDLMQDFDVAFAYELKAKSEKLQGNQSAYEAYFKKAKEAGELIKDKEDKEIFVADLASEG